LPKREDPLARFERKIDKSGECWLWTGATVGHMGYGHFSLGQRLEMAHRASWTLYRGPIPDGAWVLHTCDVPRCVNPDHLYIGDAKKNAQDKKDRGREVPLRGDVNGRALVTWDQVREIRRLRATTALTQDELGARFGLSRQAISRIVNNETWREAA